MKLTGQRNQCPTCGLYFNSNAAFDRHRTGDHTLHQRRCLTVAEMTHIGMAQNSGGWWCTALMDETPKFARSDSSVEAKQPSSGNSGTSGAGGTE